MARQSAFWRALTAAVADIAEHGYDSTERINRWRRQLRREAMRAIGASEDDIKAAVDRSLGGMWRRLVDNGKALRFVPGKVPVYKLDRIRPALRKELDRAIMASADLIKLNKEQAVAKTLQRFSGWATSLPPGGVSDETRREVKAAVSKPIAQAPFEERRVLIDQGHKLTASIERIVAVDNGAIGAVWRSKWRQPGYNYRVDHKERDGKFYLVRDSWAQAKGYVKPGPNGYLDEITQPGQEPFCSCKCEYQFALRDVPEDCLTNAGKAALEAVRAKLRPALPGS